MQEWWRFFCRCEFGFQFLAPDRVRAQLVPDLAGRYAVHDGLDQLVAPDLDPPYLSLGG